MSRQTVRHATCGCKVGWVWRQGVGRAPPRAYLQADLDLITPPGLAPSEALLCDAEAICAVIEARARLCTASFAFFVASGPLFECAGGTFPEMCGMRR